MNSMTLSTIFDSRACDRFHPLQTQRLSLSSKFLSRVVGDIWVGDSRTISRWELVNSGPYVNGWEIPGPMCWVVIEKSSS